MKPIKAYHVPVLVDEVLAHLSPRPHGRYVDATFGGGGHSRALLQCEPSCHVLAFDWDQQAVERSGVMTDEFKGRLKVVWGNFSLLYKLLKKQGISGVDGIIADFGTSQHQLFCGDGFSMHRDTPLDMRMSPAHTRVSARDIINKATVQELAEIFFVYGEDPHSRSIARAIERERMQKKIETTRELARIVEKIVARKGSYTHPATRIFQALRIVVNSELDHIKAFLPAAVQALHVGSRLVCISFHSLEDRIVKIFMREQEKKGYGRVLTKRVIKAEQKEIDQNPASRSACMRVFERT